jgi:DNA-binding response OmpR family regulator
LVNVASVHSETILLVEDSPPSRHALAWILRNHGYGVIETANGSEALALLNTREFGLLLTDVGMPIVSGLALGGYVHARWPHIPILVLSGRRPSEYDGKLRFASEFLQKPIDSATLITTVQRLLAGRRSHGSTIHDRGSGCRKKIGSQTWHVCTTCTDWPTAEFEEISANPGTQLQLCNECRLLLTEGKCV